MFSSSICDLDSFLDLPSGIRSRRLAGNRSSSLSVSPSSSSEYSKDCVGSFVPSDAEIICCRGARNRSMCNERFGKVRGSSGPLGGEEPASTPSMPLSPKAELCRSLSAVLPSCVLRGSDAGGDSTPNLEGTEAANGPLRAATDMPLLSNEFGRGASSTDKPLLGGEFANRLSWCGGEPYAGGEAAVYVISICGCSYPFRWWPYW